tara:strand:+ start:5690 stop:5935 length:246 start_codon:yes stop_codon:yes gene_type:complete
MAYAAADLHKVGGGVKSIYLYESTDAIGTIAGSGYFNDATNILNQDDVIIAVGATGGTRTVDVCVVTSASRAATVTVTNGT